jgi:phenylacetic acid degradation operon negative regulatory protein
VPGAIEDVRAFPGSRPQHLLVTLIGDYWFKREESIATAGLIDLMAEFGVPEASAISALSLMVKRGHLEAVSQGSRYRVTPETMAMVGRGADRIFTHGLGQIPWDGTWTRVSFVLPESRAALRAPLISRLRWLGFSELGTSWYAPGDRGEITASLLSDFEVGAVAIATGLVPEPEDPDPLLAWDLWALRSSYEAFIRRFRPAEERAALLCPAEALLKRTALIDIWRNFLNTDPELPAELLPDDWPLPEAGRIFRSIYDTLGPAALEGMQQVLARHDPVAAGLVDYHVSQDYPRHTVPGVTRLAGLRPAAPSAARSARSASRPSPSGSPATRYSQPRPTAPPSARQCLA